MKKHFVVTDPDNKWVRNAQKTLRERHNVVLVIPRGGKLETIKKEIYKQFPQQDITFYDTPEKSNYIYFVLIMSSSIRTSRVDSIAELDPSRKSIEELNFPEELDLQHLGSLPEFESDQPVIKYKVCKVCGRLLPETSFGVRKNGKYPDSRQTYCKECIALYTYWRRRFLKEHHLSGLVPTIVPKGSVKQTNPEFLKWLYDQKGNK